MGYFAVQHDCSVIAYHLDTDVKSILIFLGEVDEVEGRNGVN